MLNRLKKVREAVGQEIGQRREAQNNSNNNNNGSSSDNVGGQGFLCPICMTNYASAEQLQGHYEHAHMQSNNDSQQTQNQVERRPSNTSNNNACPHCYAEFPNVAAMQTHCESEHGRQLLESELTEVKKLLQEEKHFAAGLKRELEKLQMRMCGAGLGEGPAEGEDEVAYYMQQIQMLEAGKAIVTQQMLEFEKELNMMKRAHETVSKDKDIIMKKSAHMSKEVVELRSKLDEEMSQKTAFKSEAKEMRDAVIILQKQLDQRPSEDDVEVLRKELIHAQTIMDTMTQEKEGDVSRLIRELETERLKLDGSEKSLQLLQTQLGHAPKSDDIQRIQSSFNEQIVALRNELKDKGDQLVNVTQQLNEAKAGRVSVETQLKHIMGEVGSAQRAKSDLEAKLTSSEKELIDKIQQIKQFELAFDKAKSDICTLEATIEQIKTGAVKQTTDADKIEGQLKAENKQMQQKLSEVQMETNSLKQQIKSAHEDLDAANLKLKTQAADMNDVQNRLRDEQTKCTDMSHKLNSRESELNDSVSLTNELKTAVGRMENEIKEMMAKIEHDEGTQAVVAQIKTEKEQLQRQITEGEGKLNEVKQRLQNEIEQMRKTNQELIAKQQHTQEELQKSKSQLDSTQTVEQKQKIQIQQLETRLRETTEKLDATDNLRTEERQEMDKTMKDLQKMLTERSEKMKDALHQAENVTATLEQKTSQLTTLEVTFADQQGKLKTAIEKLEIAQKKAEEKERELDEMTTARHEAETRNGTLILEIQQLKSQLHAIEHSQRKHTEAYQLTEQTLRTEKTSLEAHVEKLKSDKALLSQTIEEFKTARTEQENELKRVHEKAKAEKEEAKKLIDKLKAETHQVQERMKVEHAALQTDLKSMEAEYCNSQKQVDALTNELQNVKNNASSANETAGQLEGELRQQRDAKVALEKCYDELLGEMNGATDKIQKKDSLIRELESQLATKDRNYEKLQKSQNDINETVATLSKEHELLISEKKQLNNLVDELQTECKSKDTTISEVQEHIKILTSDFEQQLKKVKQELEEKRFAYDALFSEHGRLEQQIENMTKESSTANEKNKEEIAQLNASLDKANKENGIVANKLQETEWARDKLVETIESIKTEHQHYTDRQNGVIAELTKKLSDTEVANEAEIATLTLQIKTLQDSIEETKEKCDTAIQERDFLLEEKKTIDATRQELESRTRAYADERRALMEQCLTQETAAASERDRANDFKRRLDEIMSALYELGRENQTMQLDIGKIFGRKWADDAEAVNCTSCGKQFSLTVRKHHCRHCGLIFCNECSAKSAVMTCSKKPVRVCENCFVEINAR